jgi:hypothetical protein
MKNHPPKKSMNTKERPACEQAREISDFTLFMLHLAGQPCECGPFPPAKGEREWRPTCLDVSPHFLKKNLGFPGGCWPCQAKKIVRSFYRPDQIGGADPANLARRKLREAAQ